MLDRFSSPKNYITGVNIYDLKLLNKKLSFFLEKINSPDVKSWGGNYPAISYIAIWKWNKWDYELLESSIKFKIDGNSQLIQIDSYCTWVLKINTSIITYRICIEHILRWIVMNTTNIPSYKFFLKKSLLRVVQRLWGATTTYHF